jgi:mxaK protein
MERSVTPRHRRVWLFVCALCALGALAGLDIFRLNEIAQWNARIRSAQAGNAQIAVLLAPGAPTQARFAAAWALGQRGETTQAVTLYREVAQTRSDLAGSALFNAANALVRDGARLAAQSDEVRARPLFELGKETYREALRLDSNRWDARYNLERTLRLAPDEMAGTDPVPMGGEAERSVTTMRAFTMGLP